jgi:hypothetical protein
VILCPTHRAFSCPHTLQHTSEKEKAASIAEAVISMVSQESFLLRKS